MRAGKWWMTFGACVALVAAGAAVAIRPVASPACLPAEAVLNSPRAGMVWVGPGTFPFGDEAYPEEGPVRLEHVDGFWMDKTEVTNDQFSSFVEATGYVTVAERTATLRGGVGAAVFRPVHASAGVPDPLQWWQFVPGASWRHPGGPGTDIRGKGSYPVVAVTHEDALAYATWKGHRLPTEVQWEWAAQSLPRGDARQAAANTWQGRFPSIDTGEDGWAGLSPVGCFAANRWGLHDMIGNAWELTADAWTRNHDASASPFAPPASAAGTAHVIKGGSFLCSPDYCIRNRPGGRQPLDDSMPSSHAGFRTVLNERVP